MGEAARVIDRPTPQPGGQTRLDACDADICIFGAAAGVGKSYGLLYVCGKWTQVDWVRGYRGILFRRTSPELLGGNGLWDKSQQIYRAWGGRPRMSPSLDWIFEARSGRIEDRHRIELRHLQHEDDVYAHQGRDYDFVGFDELTHFTEAQFWYMVSRLRSVSGVRPHLRATCNPDPDSFVYALIEWYLDDEGYPRPDRSGVVRWFIRDPQSGALFWYDSEDEAREENPDDDPLSFAFIHGTLGENTALLRHDPGYRSRLKALNRVDRLRLLGDVDEQGRERGGNWRIRATAGLFFPRAKFQIAKRPPSDVVARVRFWDRAYTKPTPKHPDPDWTRGVRVSLCEDGELWFDDMVSLRDGPSAVLAAMRATAENDGIETTIGTYREPGFAGKTDSEAVAAALDGYVVEFVDGSSVDVSGEGVHGTRSSRAQMALARAWTSKVEDGQAFVLQAPWTNDFVSEHDAFPAGKKDDAVAAASGGVHLLGRERATSLVEAMKNVRIYRSR